MGKDRELESSSLGERTKEHLYISNTFRTTPYARPAQPACNCSPSNDRNYRADAHHLPQQLGDGANKGRAKMRLNHTLQFFFFFRCDWVVCQSSGFQVRKPIPASPILLSEEPFQDHIPQDEGGGTAFRKWILIKINLKPTSGESSSHSPTFIYLFICSLQTEERLPLAKLGGRGGGLRVHQTIPAGFSAWQRNPRKLCRLLASADSLHSYKGAEGVRILLRSC